MIVLDASVLIAYLDSEDDHHERSETLLAREIDEDFGASPLTLGEVLFAPARENRLDDVRAVLHDLEVQELPFPRDTAVRLAPLRCHRADDARLLRSARCRRRCREGRVL